MNKKQIIMFNFLLAATFSIMMSFFMTWFNAGFTPANPLFFRIFLSGAAIGFVISLPVSFLIVPLIQKTVQKMFVSK